MSSPGLMMQGMTKEFVSTSACVLWCSGKCIRCSYGAAEQLCTGTLIRTFDSIAIHQRNHRLSRNLLIVCVRACFKGDKADERKNFEFESCAFFRKTKQESCSITYLLRKRHKVYQGCRMHRRALSGQRLLRRGQHLRRLLVR